MKKSWILTLAVSLSLGTASAQSLADTQREYLHNPRSLECVKRYYDALIASGEQKRADSVACAYRDGCPVIQIEDKETYLFLNKYLFKDPYSNEFEYGVTACRKMQWDRQEKQLTGRAARMEGFGKLLRGGVSDADQVDKRYEALSTLSSTLKREVAKQCEPIYQEKYLMPPYDSLKVEHLQMLCRRNPLLFECEALKLRLCLAGEIHIGNYDRAAQMLLNCARYGLSGASGNYYVAMMNVLGDCPLSPTILQEAVKLTLALEHNNDSGINYCQLLGKLYACLGNTEQSRIYTERAEAIEKERAELFGNILETLNQK